MEDLAGRELGRYHIIEQLGRGGMAAVYKAYDTRLNRNVAVKVILPSLEQSEEFFKRFEREARALAQLNHPNIVKIHDFGEQDGMPYLVMEYLPGGSLRTKMGKPMPYVEAARLVLPIAKALSYAHQRKIIHRDIKPANILISESGEPMLTDFGIAKMLEAQDTLALTGTGVGIGTPEYMAPEQGLGKPVDERTDIYALGIVFYELVTGRRPFQADTPMAIMVKHMTDALPRPRTYIADLPEEVERIIFTADAKQPENRYRNMDSFAEDLEGLIHHASMMPGMGGAPSKTASTIPIKKPDAVYTATQVEPRRMDNVSTVFESSNQRVSRAPLSDQVMPTVDRVKKSTPWMYIIIGGVVIVGALCVLLGGGIFATGLLGYITGNATPTVAPADIVFLTNTPEMASLPTSGEVQLGDLSSVKITPEDLPENFTLMTQNEIEQMGFTEEQLTQSITSDLSEATVQNTTAYLSGDVNTFEVIISMLIFPLTNLEKASFDIEMLNPDTFINTFSAGMDPTSSGNISVDLLPGADVVGDKSVGVSFIQSDTGTPLLGEVIVARRDRVLSMVFIFFLEGVQPVPAISISQILDAKLLSAMQ